MEDNYKHYFDLTVALTSLDLIKTEYDKLPWYKKIFRGKKYDKEVSNLYDKIWDCVNKLYNQPFVSATLILYLECTYIIPLKYSGIVRRSKNKNGFDMFYINRVKLESAIEIYAAKTISQYIERNVSITFGPLTYHSKQLTVGEVQYTVRSLTSLDYTETEYFSCDLLDFENTLKTDIKEREKFILDAINLALTDTVELLLKHGLSGEPLLY